MQGAIFPLLDNVLDYPTCVNAFPGYFFFFFYCAMITALWQTLDVLQASLLAWY